MGDEKFTSLLLEQLVEGVQLVRASDAVIIYTNPALEKMFGYGSGELIGRHVSVLNAPEGLPAEQVTEKIVSSLRATGVWRGEILNVRKDGTPFWCAASVSGFDHPTRGPVWLSVRQDITEARRMEEAVRGSEAKYRSLFEASGDAILLTDPDGSVYAANPEACRMFGRTQDEICQLGRAGLIDAADPRLATLLEERAQSGKARGELTAVRRDGTRFPAEISSILFKDREGNTRTSMLVRDITESRNTEEALNRTARELRAAYRRLAQAQDAEQRNLAKELHDQVSQNLSALSLTLSLVERELADESRAKLQRRVEEAIGLVGDTTERIRNLLGLLRPPMLDDYGLYATLRWWAHETTHLSGIECTLEGAEPAGRLPAEIESGLVRIAQEALMNAAKYSKARRITILLSAEAPVVRMEIADDGVGFEPGYEGRADATATWGMMNMRERAAGLGGHLHVVSAPGAGTRIVAEVPLVPV